MEIDERFRNKIMNDIMIRLRTMDYVLSAEEFIEAADEIERLRKRVEVLEMDYSHSVQEGIDLAKGWEDTVAEANQLREEVKETKEKQAKVIQECRKNEIRHGEMIESLVNALARHDGHDELLKDARTYLTIIFEGHDNLKAYTDYKEWHKQRMDAWYEEYMRRTNEQRGEQ